MSKIAILIARLRELDGPGMEHLVLEAISKNPKQAIEMNTDQLWSGRKADGVLMPNYSLYSIARGKPNGPIRLYDEGDFYKGFFMLAGKWPVAISSTDPKTSFLVKEYGKNIFGLDKTNLKEYSRLYVLPVLKTRIKRALAVR